ncbi:UDP-N-acetylmuramoyl-L-alanyl-D-glutamate--2,6-diaminopimelate ligase [Rhabdothermincola salaria]|uniref:UDP-N-acetylmuramoyl-L-alanyl-D-glutamate--2, 6-diaminopimelate ligase n=1 Tax=Rhabdothermincola salaria TaxID=2903142 RepID=UPI001E329C5B|nr:UDP-N-acetylmuramoyl-L-alanyl-D-glutamate--2,6-diaminopimelate ligase [Rhabdothermincola salaria]
MRVDEVASVLPGAVVIGDAAAPVADLTLDSREVAPGWLFCCVRGEHHDGHDFAATAVAAGAAALLTERRLDVAVPQIVVPESRLATALAAAHLHGQPSQALDVVGVTGTNGKTTTTHLLGAVLRRAGRSTELLGTLSGARTTPEAPDLQRRLARWRADGVDAVAMEVSSHALSLHRVDGTRFRVAVFTNLSRDHLDFHRSEQAYFEAKARLFTPELCERAVVNLDDPHGRLLADAALVPTEGYRLADAEDLQLSVAGSSFRWRDHPVRLGIGGAFNVANALAAAAAARLLGVPDDVVAAGLSDPVVVPGRFEIVDEGQPYAVIVDYAHTPDGLAHLLASVAPLVGPGGDAPGAATGRVTVVFGCGGERDREKRPLMGEVAAQGADRVILTADNSRGEDTGAIIDAVTQGFHRARPRRADAVVVEPDRRTAIAAALRAAEPGDVVVLAGKGHEATQDIGGVLTPFDDRQVARDELRRIGGAS